MGEGVDRQEGTKKMSWHTTGRTPPDLDPLHSWSCPIFFPGSPLCPSHACPPSAACCTSWSSPSPHVCIHVWLLHVQGCVRLVNVPQPPGISACSICASTAPCQGCWGCSQRCSPWGSWGGRWGMAGPSRKDTSWLHPFPKTLLVLLLGSGFQSTAHTTPPSVIVVIGWPTPPPPCQPHGTSAPNWKKSRLYVRALHIGLMPLQPWGSQSFVTIP
jgi:hypothetical protein